MAECRDIEVYKPPDLDSRLKEEKDTLEGYFWPEEFPILHKNDSPCFEREVKVKDKHYKLRVYVNSEYPRKMPDLVVCESPEPMPVDSPEWGRFEGRHETHTWPPLHGFLHICHWHWAAWKIENMIFQVFDKGKEWLEAYEKYLITKKLPLELKDMELTEKEKQRVQEQRIVQFQQQQEEIYLTMELHRRWLMHVFSNQSLSRFNFPMLPITAGEIMSVGSISARANEPCPITIIIAKPSAILLASVEPELFIWFREWAINECGQANPGYSNIVVHDEQTTDGRIYVIVLPTNQN